MLRQIILVLTILIFQAAANGQAARKEETGISLLFAGDIMGHDSQIWSAEDLKTGKWDYNDVFMYIKSLIAPVDISVANLEVTLAGPPYKGYPQFSSPAALADACKNAGFDCLVTANNHAMDRGKTGLEGTVMRLDSLGIKHTGTFLSQSSRDSLQPLIIKKTSFSVALLNYTYGTNGLRVPPPAIVNMIDKELITADIAKARSHEPDIIVLFLHWGNEYDTIPSKSQTELAEYLFSAGADMIIGSHPHVIQKMIWLRDDPSQSNRITVYSLGNFVSNQRKPKTDGGAMFRVDIKKTGGHLKIENAGYYLTWVYTPIIGYERKFYILPCSEYEMKPEFFTLRTDYEQMLKFISASRSLLRSQNVNIPEYVFSDGVWELQQ